MGGHGLFVLEFFLFGNIQTDIFGGPALILDPFFDDIFITDNAHFRLECLEIHFRKSFLVQGAKIILITVIIRRSENDPTDTALCNKSVNALGGIGRSLILLIEIIKKLLQDMVDGFILLQPDALIQRTKKNHLRFASLLL